ncbi:MAG: VOC family protein [Acidobacteriota bacterium]
MKRLLVASLLCVILVGAVPGFHGAPPSIDSQVVFLYYRDINAAADFYGRTLGLEQTFDRGWVKIYETSASSYVGLVDEARGMHQVAESKPVMLSIVTTEVDAWHRYLEAEGVPISSGLNDSADAPIRSFVVKDPGGYTVEFFQWR